jgi:hypothetical protein
MFTVALIERKLIGISLAIRAFRINRVFPNEVSAIPNEPAFHGQLENTIHR